MSERVPEGWKVSPLSSLASVNWGNTSLTKNSYAERGFPAFSAAGNDGLIENAEYNSVGVVLSAIGARCGRTFLTPVKWTAIKNTITILTDKQDITFLYQVFNFNEVWNKSGGAQPFISLGDARKTQILHPPLPEQKKIASILTSVDEVIENTQRQIDKLQDLKKATMNELLTKGIGHTEFKDSELGRIPRSWEIYRVSELLVQSKTKGKSNLPIYSVLIDGGMVNRNTQERRIPSELDDASNLYVKKGNLAYNMMRMWQGASAIAPEDCLVSPAYVVCEPNEGIISQFLGFLLKSEDSIQKLCANSQGITSDRLRLYFEHFAQIKFAIPTIEEQEKIAELISVVEMNLLKKIQILAQTESLKKSLMQDLLTGKVRVQVN